MLVLAECRLFGVWTDWNPCSRTCDSGTQTRTRIASPPNCQTRPSKLKQTRVCQLRPCALDSDVAHLLQQPCKAVNAHNVTLVIPDCLDSVDSVEVRRQRWCVGTTSSGHLVCAPVSSKTVAFKSLCFNTNKVLVALNRKCAEVTARGSKK